MKDFLKKLYTGDILTDTDVNSFVSAVVDEKISEFELGAVLYAFSKKDFSTEEYVALVKALRNQAVEIDAGTHDVVDSCGTGADFSKTVNISTCAAIVANACGAKVIKQTNSSITSVCGSSNFVEALGINICRTPQDAVEQFNACGLAFLHSPYFNKFAMKVNPYRQQLGLKTVLNFTGPLINASFPNAHLIGVSAPFMCKKVATALCGVGVKRAMVVCANEPLLDELSVCSSTDVFELKDGKIDSYTVSPSDFGLKTYRLDELQGMGADKNVNMFVNSKQGAVFDVIALNAGAMLYLHGMAEDVRSGVELAQNAMHSDKIVEKLNIMKRGYEDRLLKVI